MQLGSEREKFNQQVETVFQQEAGRVLATLIGQLRDFERLLNRVERLLSEEKTQQ